MASLNCFLTNSYNMFNTSLKFLPVSFIILKYTTFIRRGRHCPLRIEKTLNRGRTNSNKSLVVTSFCMCLASIGTVKNFYRTLFHFDIYIFVKKIFVVFSTRGRSKHNVRMFFNSQVSDLDFNILIITSGFFFSAIIRRR